MKRFSTILFFVFLLQVALKAQSIGDTFHVKYESFSIKEGLSQGYVPSIFQDKQGFMWFATKDGLNRYDGYHVKVYRNNPTDPFSLPENYVVEVIEDNLGNLWVGTNSKGMCLFDRKTEKFYTEEYFKSKNLEVIGQLRNLSFNGNLLLSYQWENIFIYDISTIKPGHYNPESLGGIKLLFKLPKPKIRSRNIHVFPTVTWMPDKSIWYCFPDTIQIYTPDANFTHWRNTSKPVSSFGVRIDTSSPLNVTTVPNSCKLLFTSGKCIAVVNLHSGKLEHQIPFLSGNNDSYRPKIEADGSAWITIDNKNWYFNCNSFILKPVKLSGRNLMPNYNNSCLDHTGILWVGSSGFGVFKFDKRKEAFHTRKKNLNPSTLFDLSRELGLKCNLSELIMFNKDVRELETFFPPQLLNQNLYKLINYSLSKEGDIWFYVLDITSNKNQLIKYTPDNKSLKSYTVIREQNSNCRSIFTDNENNLWLFFHERNGVVKLVLFDKNLGKISKKYPFPTINKTNGYSFLSAWYEDKQGTLWFGTLQGLFSFSPQTGKWKQWVNHPKDNESLSADIIFSLLPDPKEPEKYLWIGTNGGGINRFDIHSGKFLRLTVTDGLPNDVIYGILPDYYGNLWLSTNRGLSCLMKNTRTKDAWVIRNFRGEDGLAGNEFNRYEFKKLPNGLLVFGGVDGITYFNPKEILATKKPCKVVLTGISIFNKDILFHDESNILNTPPEFTKSIILHYGQNMFSVEFAVLEFENSEKKHYKYFLEGFDKNWIDNGTKNIATFTNLDPATYTLHVLGSNSDGVWSTEELTLQIIILPPWWQTWWARLGALVLLVFSILFYTRTRTKKLSRQKAELEKNVEERTEDLKNANLELKQTLEDLKNAQVQLVQQEKMASLGALTAGVAHEINNPINFVTANINPLKRNFKEIVEVIAEYENLLSQTQEKKHAEETRLNLNLQENITESEQLLNGIEEGSRRTAEIVRGLKSFSRLDENEKKETNLVDGINSTLFLLSNKLDQHNIEVEKIWGPIPYFVCLPGEMNQVFMNLLSNAIDAIEERKDKSTKGKIIITTSTENNTIKISFKDNGNGMSKDTKVRIFDPFYTTKDVGKGTGLGLSISYQIIEKHGGKIEVNSEAGQGAEFVILLPV